MSTAARMATVDTERVMDVLDRTRKPLTVKQLVRRTGLNFAEVYLAIVELRNAGRVIPVSSLEHCPATQPEGER
jgi:predicted Rossmann fold nucleotide-binding protein DprA/Smf involved in DNA uptake